MKEMEHFINGYMEIRRNRLTQQAEIRLQGSSEWQRMTDTIENSLWRAMQKEGINAPGHVGPSLFKGNDNQDQKNKVKS